MIKLLIFIIIQLLIAITGGCIGYLIYYSQIKRDDKIIDNMPLNEYWKYILKPLTDDYIRRKLSGKN